MAASTGTQETQPIDVPRFGVDLHSDAVLADPYPTFTELRDAGSVVWLDTYGYYALPRYAEVTEALTDWDNFTSTEGVGFNEYFNSIKETSLQTAGHHHDEIRRIEGKPLRPEPLRELSPSLREFAENLISDLVEKKSIDGVVELARKMPLHIVTDLVGLEGVDGEQLYQWGVAGFDSIGPMHQPRTPEALQIMAKYYEFAEENIPHCIRSGSWADQLFANGKEVGWSEEFCRGMMNDYIYPSVDSTINGISAGLLLFAQNPQQWEILRNDRSLLTSAIPEIIRLASPLQYFTRVTTTDIEIGGVTLPKDSRVLIMFASANRDERKFSNPDEFDITRDPNQHVGWGRGKHSCLGKPLARQEMITLFDVLADHVERFEVGEYEYQPNNIIRGIGRMDLTLHQ